MEDIKMLYFVRRVTVLIILLSWTVGNAADSIDHGPYNTVNWDYFTANENADTKRMLQQVQQNHLDRSWGHAKGVMGFIADKRYRDAKLDLDYTLGRFPNHPRALMLLEMVAKLNNEPSLPIRYYENALRLYPQYAVTRAQYGNYLVQIKELEPGIARLSEAAQMDPKLVAAHVWLARAYHQVGNFELARESQEKARELGYKGEFLVPPAEKK
jgi:Tfp pilus assembly protein PilF